ncbi:hypothetical protein OH799_00350 [Nocardia sp. NBC_00881]|uniref:hypothetical protein n=1 Tax=Nocardia sp. NBC_00881 TaxID=2975995 RepID=UPI0038654054|nr:hypothetical protein OH799_00350 [Nocardia sp. NBC_00881]
MIDESDFFSKARQRPGRARRGDLQTSCDTAGPGPYPTTETDAVHAGRTEPDRPTPEGKELEPIGDHIRESLTDWYQENWDWIERRAAEERADNTSPDTYGIKHFLRDLEASIDTTVFGADEVGAARHQAILDAVDALQATLDEAETAASGEKLSASTDDPAAGGSTDTGALTDTARTDTTVTKCRLPSHEAVSQLREITSGTARTN